MEKDPRVHYGYWDLVHRADEKGPGLPDKLCETLVDQFLLLAAKGLHHMEAMKLQTAYEEIVKKLVTNHPGIRVRIKTQRNDLTQNKMPEFIDIQRKPNFDVYLHFKIKAYTEGYGLMDHTVLIYAEADKKK